MRNKLVYDLPLRLFHWLFVSLFLAAFVIAKTIDDDSPVFSYHSLAGLALSYIVFLRILWGAFGTKHAKFSDFALNPREAIRYFTSMFTGGEKRWAGHNPASSWAAIAMMVMGIGLGVTGYLMTSGAGPEFTGKETFEDFHELLANGFIVVAASHVLGIILHTLRHKEMIGLSMVDGKKAEVPELETIPSIKTSIGALFIALVLAYSFFLYRNYDTETQSLEFFGTTLHLGD